VVGQKRASRLTWPRFEEAGAFEHDRPLRRGCVEPTGQVVLADAAGKLLEWSPGSSGPALAWKAHDIDVTSLTCTSRGIVSTGADFTLAIWPRATVEGTRIRAHAEVLAGVWNPREPDEILIAASDQTARIWSLSQARDVRVLSGHTGSITDAVYEPSGMVVTSSRDGSVRLWDPANGVAVGALRHGGRTPDRVVSGPFGVISASRDGTLTWWDITLEASSPEIVDRLVSCRAPYRLQGESLVVSQLVCTP